MILTRVNYGFYLIKVWGGRGDNILKSESEPANKFIYLLIIGGDKHNDNKK